MNLMIERANRWRDSFNPLRGLTMSRAVQLMEAAQRGVMADLQWLYGSELGIEATDPDLMTIIERTIAGVADMDWQIITAQDMALLQKSGYLTPLRSRFPSARVIPVWNQADTEELRQAALSMLEFLGEKDGLITCTLP